MKQPLLLVALFLLNFLHQTTCQKCSIQLYLSDDKLNRIFTIEKSDHLEIFTDIDYTAICKTSEKVRRNSRMSLMSIKTNRVLIISERAVSIRNTNITSTSGGLKITNQADSLNEEEEFILYCRFLTIDPSVYCEESIRICVVSSLVSKFNLVLVILGVAVMVATFHFVIRLCLKLNRNDSSAGYDLTEEQGGGKIILNAENYFNQTNCELQKENKQPYQIIMKEPIYENDWEFACRSVEMNFKF